MSSFYYLELTKLEYVVLRQLISREREAGAPSFPEKSLKSAVERAAMKLDSIRSERKRSKR